MSRYSPSLCCVWILINCHFVKLRQQRFSIGVMVIVRNTLNNNLNWGNKILYYISQNVKGTYLLLWFIKYTPMISHMYMHVHGCKLPLSIYFTESERIFHIICLYACLHRTNSLRTRNKITYTQKYAYMYPL